MVPFHLKDITNFAHFAAVFCQILSVKSRQLSCQKSKILAVQTRELKFDKNHTFFTGLVGSGVPKGGNRGVWTPPLF